VLRAPEDAVGLREWRGPHHGARVVTRRWLRLSTPVQKHKDSKHCCR
jgi:hypothetical protein